jgi:hypothetical protein
MAVVRELFLPMNHPSSIANDATSGATSEAIHTNSERKEDM